MQVLHVEGLANRNDPESCVGPREGSGEALTGEHVGRVSSREMLKVQGADAVEKSEGDTRRCVMASAVRPCVV